MSKFDKFCIEIYSLGIWISVYAVPFLIFKGISFITGKDLGQVTLMLMVIIFGLLVIQGKNVHEKKFKGANTS